MAQPDFRFPLDVGLPYFDRGAGLALPRAGMRGSFQAGALHALVMCGYHPHVVSGTSAGALSGAVLAIAGTIADPADPASAQARRLELVADYLRVWLENPALDVVDQVRTGPLARLAGDLLDIDLSLEDVLRLGARALSGRESTAARLSALYELASKLPRDRPGMLCSLFQAAGSGVAHLGEWDVALHVAQQFLNVYGVRQALVPQNFVDRYCRTLLEKYLTRPESILFSDFSKHTQLLASTCNLSRPKPGSQQASLLVLGSHEAPDPKLLPALRASAAFAPVFPGERLGRIFDRVPGDLGAGDLLMDSSLAEKDTLAPVVSHWAREAASGGPKGPFRLFAVYQEPLGGAPPPNDKSPYFGPAVHSLELLESRDLAYSARVVASITEMVEALEAEGQALPRRSRTSRYVAVHVTSVAPDDLLPYGMLSVPEDGEIRDTAAMGCRAMLEALHAEAIDCLKGDTREEVPCAELLAAVRARRTAPTPAGFFEPHRAFCTSCPGLLGRRRPRCDHAPKTCDPPPAMTSSKGLQICVPAGGVFLGVFQFGALGALRAYRVEPDVYAGASVGTLFSFLLDAVLNPIASSPADPGTAAATAPTSALAAITELSLTVPEWVDHPPGDGPHVRPGLVDAFFEELGQRWRSDGLASFRRLRPRSMLMAWRRALREGRVPEDSEAALVFEGLRALLFTPLDDRRTGRPRQVPDAYALEEDGEPLAAVVRALARFRPRDAVDGLDAIAAYLDLWDPGPRSHRGELIGFEAIRAQLARIAGIDPKTTLAAHSRARRVRFLFTVTDQTDGVLEHFGMGDDDPSPLALEACLAACSFPLAFRRRSRREVFGTRGGESGWLSDGGAFNNFPSDSAFEYLRRLSARGDQDWVGRVRHDVLMLSLTSPIERPRALGGDDQLLVALRLSLALSEDEKVEKTLNAQRHLNALAARANPVLAAQGRGQHPIADVTLVSPAYTIYWHPFAVKEALGFRRDKQEEMLASGCRRARMALEWRAWQRKIEVDADNEDRQRNDLREALKTEAKAQLDVPPPVNGGSCVFGRMNETEGTSATVPCPFAQGQMRPVYLRCRETVMKELAVEDLKLPRALFPASQPAPSEARRSPQTPTGGPGSPTGDSDAPTVGPDSPT